MASPRTPLVLVSQRGADATDGWAMLMGRELVASRMQSNWHSSACTLFGRWKAFPCLICPVPWKEEGCLLGAKLLFFCAATCPAHRADSGDGARLQLTAVLFKTNTKKKKTHNCSSLHLSRALDGCACSLSQNKAGNCLCSRLPRAAKPPQLCCLLCHGADERNEALPAAVVAASTLPILWQMESRISGLLPVAAFALLHLGKGWLWPQVLESSEVSFRAALQQLMLELLHFTACYSPAFSPHSDLDLCGVLMMAFPRSSRHMQGDVPSSSSTGRDP